VDGDHVADVRERILTLAIGLVAYTNQLNRENSRPLRSLR
jgi:hypothetical protein